MSDKTRAQYPPDVRLDGSTRINRTLRQKFMDALRGKTSKKYVKAGGSLHEYHAEQQLVDSDGNNAPTGQVCHHLFCGMGVLIDIVEGERYLTISKDDTEQTYAFPTSFTGSADADWLASIGLTDEEEMMVIRLNDRGKSFEDIANAVEESW